MEFYETIMGKRFFEHQLPRLLDMLERIGNTLENLQNVFLIQPFSTAFTTESQEEELLDLLYDRALKSSGFSEAPRLAKGRQETLSALGKLEKTLSKEQWNLFLQYNAAVNLRSSEESREMFRQGYGTAIRLMAVGLLTNENKENGKKG